MQKEEVLQKLGLAEASEEVQEKAISDVASVVELRFADMVEKMLTPEQEVELEQVVNREDKAELSAWMKVHVPDAEGLYDAILTDYIEELVQYMNGRQWTRWPTCGILYKKGKLGGLCSN